VEVRGDVRPTAADRLLEETRTIAAQSNGVMSTGRWAWEWSKSIVIAFGLFLLIRSFLVEAFRIPTGSMENTLLVGDFLLVNKAIYGTRLPLTDVRLPGFAAPRRGDVLVFVPPHDPGKNYVKRLVGVAGDTLSMRDKVLFLNGRAVHEPYARHSDPNDLHAPQMIWQCAHRPVSAGGRCWPARDNWGPVVVPADHYMVLGDNRDDSEDSRYWGFVERDAIRGRPLLVYYSFDPRIAEPLPWLTGIRWARMGEAVH